MFTNALIALAATSLFGQAVAGGAHHAHQHLHKKDLVTEVTTVTNWVTVYAHGSKVFYAPTRKLKVKTTSTTTSTSSSEAPPPPPPSSPAAAPTTFATQPKPVPTEPKPEPTIVAAPAVEPAPEPEPAAPPAPKVVEAQAAPAPTNAVPAPVPNGGGSGRAQRGLAYNHANLLPGFLGSGSKVTWKYNWAQVDDSKTDLEFVPMLWGNRQDWFVEKWDENAGKAINAGSKCLLSFNEPDIGSQANMSPQLAAREHIRLMNPWASKARIGSPAISSSTSKNMGIDWMKQFFAACGGKCKVDFIAAHSYGHKAEGFLAHLIDVHEAFGLPVWVTEFQFPGSEDEVNKELAFVIKELETNDKYSFVERYAYFMAAEGMMVSGNAPNKYGKTFAYSS